MGQINATFTANSMPDREQGNSYVQQRLCGFVRWLYAFKRVVLCGGRGQPAVRVEISIAIHPKEMFACNDHIEVLRARVSRSKHSRLNLSNVNISDIPCTAETW